MKQIQDKLFYDDKGTDYFAGSASERKAQYFLKRMWNKFHYMELFPFMSCAYIKNVRGKNRIPWLCIHVISIARNSLWCCYSTPSVYRLPQFLKTQIWIHLLFRLDWPAHKYCLPFSCYSSFQVHTHINWLIFCIWVATEALTVRDCSVLVSIQ